MLDTARYVSGWLRSLAAGDASNLVCSLITLDSGDVELLDAIVQQLDGLAAMCRAKTCNSIKELREHSSLNTQMKTLLGCGSILIPGGLGSHQLVFRLARCQETPGQFAFSVFNSGGKGTFFHPWALDGTKLRRHCIISYAKIPESILFSTITADELVISDALAELLLALLRSEFTHTDDQDGAEVVKTYLCCVTDEVSGVLSNNS